MLGWAVGRKCSSGEAVSVFVQTRIYDRQHDGSATVLVPFIMRQEEDGDLDGSTSPEMLEILDTSSSCASSTFRLRASRA